MTRRLTQALALLGLLDSALEDFETNGEVETAVERTYLRQASQLLREELEARRRELAPVLALFKHLQSDIENDLPQ
jgi:hypothetical protein